MGTARIAKNPLNSPIIFISSGQTGAQRGRRGEHLKNKESGILVGEVIMVMVMAMVHLGDDQDDDKDDNDDNDPYATEDHGGSGLSPALQMSHHSLVHRPIKRGGEK